MLQTPPHPPNLNEVSHVEMCTFSGHCLESLVFQLWWRSRRRSEVRVLTFRAGWTLQIPLSSISDRPQIPKYACKASENEAFFFFYHNRHSYLHMLQSTIATYLLVHHVKIKLRKMLNTGFETCTFSKSQNTNLKKKPRWSKSDILSKKISLTKENSSQMKRWHFQHPLWLKNKVE